ncbi:MAG TPA: sulfatase/phosphatase domain-containing protein, partial [Chitinophagaceae bacterium]|nr:sulfatase/phosphatase domain-containing protein [Chitinophagaceae bacterium]
VTNIITELSTEWIDKRDTSRPFFLVIGEKATHREWLPDLQDLGAYDSVNFPLPPNFYDTYEGRDAAAHQDMTIDKTMILSSDLKVHLDYSRTPGYRRFSADQKKTFSDYYEKVDKEFDRNKYSGKALAAWKYQRYMKDYLSVAKSLDRNIGHVLDYLDKTGLSKNTVVIYASDQGFYLGEHGWFDKRFIYEESLRTPFVMRYPGVIKAGTVIEEFTINSDWAPTLLDLAKTGIPQDMQGKSFLPLLANRNTREWRKDIYYHYYEFPQPHHVYPHFGMRNERYKLIYFYGDKSSWELFDLLKDPGEMKNLYGSPGMDGVTTQLKARLRELVLEYKDDDALKLLSSQKNL